MARVKRSVHGKKHRRAVLEAARGYHGNRSRSFKSANEQVMHSGEYAFRDRRARKGQFRRLWIVRINAACRQQRHLLFAVHGRTACKPGSRSTGRSWPTWRSLTRPPSRRWWPRPGRPPAA